MHPNHRKKQNSGEPKVKCPNCGQYQFGEAWWSNHSGCTFPLIGVLFIFVSLMVVPEAIPLSILSFVVLTIVGIIKQVKTNKSGLQKYKCDNCNLEAVYNTKSGEWQ